MFHIATASQLAPSSSYAAQTLSPSARLALAAFDRAAEAAIDAGSGLDGEALKDVLASVAFRDDSMGAALASVGATSGPIDSARLRKAVIDGGATRMVGDARRIR